MVIRTLPVCSRNGFDGLECQEVTIRKDGEPSICALIRHARELCAEGATAVDEVSPPGDSAANGVAERVILTTWRPREDDEGCCGRTFCLLVVPPARVPRRGWCTMQPRYSTPAQSVQVGSTPFRRLKGRKCGYREPPLEKVNKFNPRCVEARLLGILPQVISIHRGGL